MSHLFCFHPSTDKRSVVVFAKIERPDTVCWILKILLLQRISTSIGFADSMLQWKSWKRRRRRTLNRQNKLDADKSSIIFKNWSIYSRQFMKWRRFKLSVIISATFNRRAAEQSVRYKIIELFPEIMHEAFKSTTPLISPPNFSLSCAAWKFCGRSQLPHKKLPQPWNVDETPRFPPLLIVRPAMKANEWMTLRNKSSSASRDSCNV